MAGGMAGLPDADPLQCWAPVGCARELLSLSGLSAFRVRVGMEREAMVGGGRMVGLMFTERIGHPLRWKSFGNHLQSAPQGRYGQPSPDRAKLRITREDVRCLCSLGTGSCHSQV